MVMKESPFATIDDFFFHGSVAANMVHLNKDNDNEQESKESLHVFSSSGKGIKFFLKNSHG
jgi:hypothetical protein